MVYKLKNNYSWIEGHSYAVNANVVGKVLEQISETNGEVTREAFLDASRPEESPTHSMFEWDDSIAAEKYRLSTASTIIGFLRIVPEETQEPIRAFINVSPVNTKCIYESITTALKDEKKRNNYLSRIKAEIDALIQRNKNIEELADLLIDAGNKLKGETK